MNKKTKNKECPFCFKEIKKSADNCPYCKTAFKKSCEAKHQLNKHGRGKGDTARKMDSDYQGGYVD